MNRNIYWVGPRESDIAACKHLFAGSITLFGSGQGSNISMCSPTENPERVDHNDMKDTSQDYFMREHIFRVLREDPNAVIYFYNGNIYNGLIPYDKDDSSDRQLAACRDRIICLNDPDMMKQWNDKRHFHESLRGKTDLLHIEKVGHAECRYENLRRRFGLTSAPDCRFVVQAPVASGGSGTFILDKYNDDTVYDRSGNGEFLVSVYQEQNVSVNIHAIIYSDDIVLLPPSIQLMREDDFRLMYRGADFIAYRGIDKDLRDRFESDCLKACKVFQAEGYRGVCGIDAILAGGSVHLLELNNRFQSSTGLIDRALADNGMRHVAELNIEAFALPCADPEEKAKLHDLIVDYSNYNFINNDMPHHAKYLHSVLQNEKHVVEVENDGFCVESPSYHDLAHLYRVVFDTNISWVNTEGYPYINENIADPPFSFYRMIVNRNTDVRDNKWLALKLSLMTQGVRITEEAMKKLESGGIRPATNNAVDIVFSDGGEKFVVNAPRDIKFSSLAPYWITVDNNNRLRLHYYNEAKPVDSTGIEILPVDSYSTKLTSNGTPYSDVAYLSTDRLRVHLTNQCRFKREGTGCQFCNMEMTCGDISIEDIREVVEDYCKNNDAVKHFLVGGQSADDDVAIEKLVEVINIIAENSEGNIYAMVLPYSKKIIFRMYHAGLTEIACNIEIFDSELAKKFMPGKGNIDRQQYFDKLEYATTLFSRGSVRSMAVVGLEPRQSLIRGIRDLVNIDVQPMLSIFRPLPGTPLEDLVIPSLRELYDLYYEVEAICAENDLHLGPKCVWCQNNTLSMPYDD